MTFSPETIHHSTLVAMEARLRQRGILRKPLKISDDDWLHLNLYFYYNLVSEYYGYLQKECKCDRMSVTPKYKFSYQDDLECKKEAMLPCFLFVEKTMSHADSFMKSIQFVKPSFIYPRGLRKSVKEFIGKFIIIFAHLCTMHEREWLKLDKVADFARAFRSIIVFSVENQLLDTKMIDLLREIMEIAAKSAKEAESIQTDKDFERKGSIVIEMAILRQEDNEVNRSGSIF